MDDYFRNPNGTGSTFDTSSSGLELSNKQVRFAIRSRSFRGNFQQVLADCLKYSYLTSTFKYQQYSNFHHKKPRNQLEELDGETDTSDDDETDTSDDEEEDEDQGEEEDHREENEDQENEDDDSGDEDQEQDEYGENDAPANDDEDHNIFEDFNIDNEMNHIAETEEYNIEHDNIEDLEVGQLLHENSILLSQFRDSVNDEFYDDL